MRKIAFILLLSITVLSSCGSTSSKKVNLDDTLFKYASFMRWSDYDSASRFVKPGEGSIKLSNFELRKLKQFKISRYTESPISPGDKESIIVQSVELQLYNIHNNKTKIIIDNQSWEYVEKAKQWFLISGLPKL